MPKVTKGKGGQSAADKKKAAQAAEASKAKRAAREAQDAEQREYVAKHYLDGDETLAAVAKKLSITSGKAAFIGMQIRVERGEVPKITGKGDEALLKAINAARLKADEYSSWGWLAARSGRSEGFIKTGLAAAGLYTPRGENIASTRSANKPAKAATTTPAGKKGGKKVAGNA